MDITEHLLYTIPFLLIYQREVRITVHLLYTIPFLPIYQREGRITEHLLYTIPFQRRKDYRTPPIYNTIPSNIPERR